MPWDDGRSPARVRALSPGEPLLGEARVWGCGLRRDVAYASADDRFVHFAAATTVLLEAVRARFQDHGDVAGGAL